MRALFALALCLASSAAAAEDLVTSVSTPRLGISSNFAGAEIVVFGVIERDASSISRSGPYQAAIVVSGPRRAIDVREKDRIAGIWINRQRRVFDDAPTFLAIQASRPVADIATPSQIAQLGLTLPLAIAPSLPPEEVQFRDALIRLKQNSNLYSENPFNVAFLTGSLFRTTVRLPPNVPLGTFTVDTYVFSGNVKVAESRQSFEVYKTGFEERVALLARERALAYGLATAAIALLFGWIATIIFRRD